jgi:lipopolysaccharide transport system permease protein
VLHLARNELAAMHRFTLFGPAWPLARLLAQWGVLAFVFTSLVDLSIDDYPVFLLCGLVAWSWFAAGVTAGTSSLVAQRHLVLQPRLPAAVLPAVSVAVPLVDVIVALPPLVALLLATKIVHWSILFLPLLIAVQFVLMTAIVWLSAAITVYFRDVRNVVEVGLTLLFYFTPIFYDLRRVPDDLRRLLELNPMTTIVDGWRSVLIDGRIPDAGGLLVVAAGSIALAALALVVFRRLEGGFADEL